jgi:catechol 2,3-dioxygenase-like lactoylglutathione lyase family enzyme
MNNQHLQTAANNVYIEGIQYTEIPVPDLEKAVDWYCGKLGAKLGLLYDELAFVDFSMGPSLFLVKTNDDTTATFKVNGQDHYTIGFRVKDIQGFHNFLSQLSTKASPIVVESHGSSDKGERNNEKVHTLRS